MRPYIFIIISALLISFGSGTKQAFSISEQSNNLYKKVLQQYVVDGLVNYAAIKSYPKDLNEYLKESSKVSNEEFNKWDRNEQLAFLINLYNAHTIDLIANNYPVKSINEIGKYSGGPWGQPVVNLFGNILTLDELEHQVIEKNYSDARVHFALVCAALGCPVLINTPYEGSILEDQLDQQTRIFLSDRSKNSIDKGAKLLRLSPIFDWYREDFIKQSGSVIGFVNPYFDNKATSEFRIEYTNYDWSLNDLSSKKN